MSHALDGPGSIFGISGFSFVLFSYVLTFMHSVFCTALYVLFIVCVTLPPGIGSIAVGNKHNYAPENKYGRQPKRFRSPSESAVWCTMSSYRMARVLLVICKLC
jgi:hypothetical protein